MKISTPLYPESPSLEAGGGRQIKYQSTERPRLLRRPLRAFTLLEILIATVIFLILILVIFQAMQIGRDAFFTGSTLTDLRRQIIQAFMAMEPELNETRPAQISLMSGASSSFLTFKIPQDIDGDGTVLDASGAIEWSQDITYALNAVNQITRTAPGAATVLANDITRLQFTRPLSPVNILQIDITARKTSPEGRQLQDSGQIIIKMRN